MIETETTTGREFWSAVLGTGGFTEIPRWTLEPAAGVGLHREPIPAELVTALRRVADESAVSFSSVLLTAHLAVLLALSGEDEISTGYVPAPERPPLPFRLTAAPGSWRSLLLTVFQNESGLLWHKDFPVAELQRELGSAGPAFEVVFDPTAVAAGADATEPTPGTVLWVGFSAGGDQLLVRYRRSALDAGAAARIAGYHATALRLLATDPDADHRRHSLVSAAEVRYQLQDLAGPDRELPDRRVHELFEEQVRAHPEAVAAEHRGRRLTYGELNGRANRLAQALVSRGVAPEGVVAVVSERNLDWMAAVLAVFKAGAAYLPIEPHFPADRIARTLNRAGCSVVLCERGGSDTLDAAVRSSAAVARIFFDDAYAENPDAGDPRIAVTADQLAYIYFTSGSTGEPKGAMCEHAGMLNHLFAKIDDLEIDDTAVVAQIAPQCFDISLWQLVSAVLVGGRTLLIEQDVILDVQRFVDTIVAGRVTVLQVVPSYLEVVLSYLEQHPREFPDLRYVSVTGEALKKELTERWFAAQPLIRLVNAYGLTETSDDTNHEVMSGPPAGDRVPLGRPVNNVHVYVLDSRQLPVPLGAPGEIAFSGVCVGRGYINDPERTRMAFLPDPLRAGRRLYRAGDFGRWRPDGKLEYLGRRDSQVKIAGFRIEIGEIENALLGVPGVADGAVVVAGQQHQNKRLVAFYSAASALPAEVLHGHLATSLPAYMVPSAFHWRERLPLTANGKIDRKTLGVLAAELASGEPTQGARAQAAGTPTEIRLTSAFAAVLGIPEGQVSRDDNFFDKGGTSLSAVKLAITLNRIVSLADITRSPVLADLARVIDTKTEALASTH